MMRNLITGAVVVLMVAANSPFAAADDEGLASMAGACDDSTAGALEPDKVLHETVRKANLEKYAALQEVFSQSELETMDRTLAAQDMQADSLVQETRGDSEETVYGSSANDIEVGNEKAFATTSAEVTKKVLEIAEGATPTLNVFVHLGEKSRHQDYWTFYAEATVLESCQAVGNTSDWHPLEDKQARTDVWQGILELPLSEAVPEDVTYSTVEVQLRVIMCSYGWFTGSFKGCKPAETTEELVVKILNVNA